MSSPGLGPAPTAHMALKLNPKHPTWTCRVPANFLNFTVSLPHLGCHPGPCTPIWQSQGLSTGCPSLWNTLSQWFQLTFQASAQMSPQSMHLDPISSCVLPTSFLSNFLFGNHLKFTEKLQKWEWDKEHRHRPHLLLTFYCYVLLTLLLSLRHTQFEGKLQASRNFPKVGHALTWPWFSSHFSTFNTDTMLFSHLPLIYHVLHSVSFPSNPRSDPVPGVVFGHL